MLTNPDIDVMLHNEANQIGNKFSLITLVAKRAANLRSGNPPLVDVPCRNPVSVALHEISQGKVSSRHPVAGAVSVTTPQVVSLADTRRAVKMYEKLTIPTLGLVENMSYYACPNCHVESDIFGHGGGEQLAEEMGLAFLGRLPIYQPIRVGADRGVPLVIAEPQSPAGKGFTQLAQRVAMRCAVAAHENAIKHKGKIPLIQVR